MNSGCSSERISISKLTFWRAILLSKSLVLLTVIMAAWYGKFSPWNYLAGSAAWPPRPVISLTSRLAAWDAAHYLMLSSEGYKAGSRSCAFYPLWPAAIRATTFLTLGSPLITSLLLANALSLLALWLLHSLVECKCGERTANQALIILLASPGALFFCLPYTESLYLTMVLVFLWGLERNRYLWPCLMAYLMPLTKAIGVFLLLPLAWHLFQQRKALKYWWLLLVPILGYATYLFVMFAWTGNALEGFEAQKAYPYSPSIRNMFEWPAFFAALLNVRSLDGMKDSALDRGLFALFLALLPLIFRLNKTWFFYTLPAGLIPAMTSYFMSYRRYIMVCFPVFIVLAQLLDGTKRRWPFWYYVVLLATLQAWAVTQFICFNWAG